MKLRIYRICWVCFMKDHKLFIIINSYSTPKKLCIFSVSYNSWMWPNKPKYIYGVFLSFHFCDTHLEVPLISMRMYHLEPTPVSYKLPLTCRIFNQLFSFCRYNGSSSWCANPRVKFLLLERFRPIGHLK